MRSCLRFLICSPVRRRRFHSEIWRRWIGLATRFESFSHWDELRAKDESGLAPDEQAVASFILEGAMGDCTPLTDFPIGGRPVFLGKKRYFVSSLDATNLARCCVRLGHVLRGMDMSLATA